ncbi:WXG100 family type VII secretion target [Kitasatospora sp. McL0602]|uniref:WXG100 family type VII secretion target n=1 Tax=Kitasatospora sp. McL0602 TaxID=3439530 RepID=UPI003F8BF70E
MGDHILVSFSTIQNAASEVRQTASRIQQQLDELKAGVTRIASSWEGVAQEGYRARQAQWDAKAADLQQALGQISTSLENAAQNYQNTENKNAGIWN